MCFITYHKSKIQFMNRLLINTPITANWDSDTNIDKKSVMDADNILRSSQADIAYPYNGIVYQTSDILRRYYLNTKDIKVLYKKPNMLYFLCNQPMKSSRLFPLPYLFQKNQYKCNYSAIMNVE